jgi:hypothetical protein
MHSMSGYHERGASDRRTLPLPDAVAERTCSCLIDRHLAASTDFTVCDAVISAAVCFCAIDPHLGKVVHTLAGSSHHLTSTGLRLASLRLLRTSQALPRLIQSSLSHITRTRSPVLDLLVPKYRTQIQD